MDNQLFGRISNASKTLQGILVNKTLSIKGVLSVSGQPVIIGDIYTGPYKVTPKVNETQTLLTQLKAMTNNVVVAEIPYYETSNTSGLTAIIGGNNG